MAQTIKLKRSATQGAVPSTSALALGEIAINTYDGTVFIKKNDGSESIVTIGALSDNAITSAKIAGNAVQASEIAANSVGISELNLSDGTSGQVLKTDGSGNLSFADDNASGSSTSIVDGDNDTKIQVEESTDEDKIRFDTGGTQRAIIDSTGLTVGDITINSSTISDGGDFTIDAGGDITFDADGGDFRFKDAGTQQFLIDLDTTPGSVILRTNTADGDMIFQGNDDSSVITALTLDMSDAGTAYFNHNVRVNDDDKFIAGTSGDLQLYHDATDSYIQNHTGSLYINNLSDDKDIFIQSDNGAGGLATYLFADGSEGSLKLFHYGSLKLATSSTGISVTGNITNTSGDLTLDVIGDISLDADGGDVILKDGGTTFGSLSNVLGGLTLKSGPSLNNAIIFSTDGDSIFSGDISLSGTVDGVDISARDAILTSTTTTANAALPKAGGTMTGNIAHAGDFTLDVGGDLFLDADGAGIYLSDGGTSVGRFLLSSSDLTIGNLVQDKDIKFAGNDGGSGVTALTLDMSDAGSATFNNDVTVGGNLTVNGTTTTLNTATLDVEDKNITLNKGSGDTSGSANGAGLTIQDAVDASNDATILWNATNDEFDFSHGITLPDNQKLELGTGNDLSIYHDGSQSIIEDVGTGQLKILGENTIHIGSATGSHSYIRALKSGAVELYHNNVKKIETTSAGVDVTGVITTDGLNVENSAGYGSIELGGTSGGFIDLKNPMSDDFDLRIITSGTGGLINSGSGEVAIQRQGSTKLSTSSTGIDVTGTATMDGLTVNSGTTDQVALFESTDQFADLALKDSGGTSYIRQSNGSLILEADRANASSNSSTIIKVDDSEKMRLDSTGVGIGTSSPSTLLELNTNSFEAMKIRRGTSGTDASVITFAQGDGTSVGHVGGVSSGGLQFRTGSGSGTERARIDSSGNLGIGRTNPGYDLDVLGSGATTARFASTGGADTLVRIIAGDYNTERDARLFIGEDDTHGLTVEYDGVDNIGYIGMNNSVDPTGSYSKRISMPRGNTHTYFSAGNVGIGTTSPSHLLHVTGSVAGGYAAKVENTNSTNGFGLIAKTAHTGTSAFAFGAYAASNPLMVVRSDSNVGIGTDSPNAYSGYTTLTLNHATTGGIIDFEVDGTLTGEIYSNNTGIGIQTAQADDDIIFKGNDGGSTITALTLDMSDAGKAIFNAGAEFANTTLHYGNGAASLAWGDTSGIGQLSFSGNNAIVRSTVSDGDLVFQGNDGGSSFTALTLDMSDAGKAVFNAGATFANRVEINYNGDYQFKIDNNVTEPWYQRVQSDGTFALHLNGTGNIFHATSSGIGVTGDIDVTSTDAGSSAGPIINLVRDSSSPADADYLGQIKFKGENDNGASTVYSKITGKIDDASNGSEDGIIEFAAQKAGSSTILARLKSSALKLLNGTIFEGDLTGDVTGNVSGTAATVTTAAQPNITSLGTLTTLTVDDITINGSTISDSGNFTIDVGADISLDSSNGIIRLKDDGTEFGKISQNSNNLRIFSSISDGDILIQGNDGGSSITALTLDMSDAGSATFNNDVTVGGNLTIQGTTTTLNTATLDVEDKNITLNKGSGDTSGSADGAGLTIQDAVDASNDATLLWDASNDEFDFSHKVTAPALTVDNIGIDGNTLSTSTGGLTLDVVGDIQLNADGGDITFNDGGAVFGVFSSTNSDLNISTTTSDEDIVFKGNDGGSTITALTLDMSDGGAANFGGAVVLGGSLIKTGDMTLDATGDIILDADGANILLKDGGTQFGEFENSSNDFRIKSVQQDKDIIFRGNDGGTYINALTLDMSNAGTAIFNNGISEDGTAKSYTWRAVGNSGSSGHRWVKIARISGVQSTRVSIDLVGRAGYGDANKPSYARVIGQLNNDNDFDFSVQTTGTAFEEIGQVDVSTTETDIYVKITSFAELSAHGVISSGTITPTTGNSGSSQGEGSEPTGYVAFTESLILLDDGMVEINNASFPDNGKAIFGAGDDLQIYHTGSNSFVTDVGTGSLNLRGTNIYLADAGGNSFIDLIDLGTGGRVDIKHETATKLSTASDGIDIKGDSSTVFGLNIIDPTAATYGAHFSFDDSNTKVLIGGVTDGTKNTAISIPRDSTQVDFASHITLPDSAIAKFGAGSDLQIYHDGSNSYIWDNGTGLLQLRTNGSRIEMVGQNGSEYMARFEQDGAVKLYYDNSQKLATTSTGIDVTGTATMDGLDSSGTAFIRGASAGRINLDDSGVADGSQPFKFLSSDGGSLIFGTANRSGTSTTSSTEIARFDSSGNFGIGTTSPASPFHVYHATTDTVANFESGDASVAVNFTASDNSMQIATSGTDGIIKNNGAGNFRFFNNGSERARIDSSGNVGIGTTTPGSKLEVNGSFAATTKSFDIEHPTKEGMRLHHGVLEGPEHAVYIRGKSDSYIIELPDYWEGLVHKDSITVQLTAIGGGQNLYVEDIKDNKVYVNGENYFYYIQAERKDVERFEVEYSE